MRSNEVGSPKGKRHFNVSCALFWGELINIEYHIKINTCNRTYIGNEFTMIQNLNIS